MAWLVSVLCGEATDPEDIKGVSPPVPAADAEDSDDGCLQPTDDSLEPIPESSSEAILRDVREQNLFR